MTQQEPVGAFHGGAFFDAIGREFDNLRRIDRVINADVLDAWFPPSPMVIRALGGHLSWSIKTSPPTGSEGLIAWIARARGVAAESILPGAGSSSLIFLALRHWLTPSSKTLILDPTYGEYPHVLETVIGCGVQRLPLNREDGYVVDLERLEAELSKGYDLAVLVNPNNPTGQHIPRRALEELLSRVSPNTKFWIDEAYVDYVDRGESLEAFASASPNVFVCKSMSKVYGLSGLRVGYLCGPKPLIDELRVISPPWSVSLPGQLAAVMALQDPEYYSERYLDTHRLRLELTEDLRSLGDLEVAQGAANYLLCYLPPHGPDTEELLARCREHDLFLRNPAATSPRMGPRAFRIAVKDAETNGLMAEILRAVLNQGS